VIVKIGDNGEITKVEYDERVLDNIKQMDGKILLNAIKSMLASGIKASKISISYDDIINFEINEEYKTILLEESYTRHYQWELRLRWSENIKFNIRFNDEDIKFLDFQTRSNGNDTLLLELNGYQVGITAFRLEEIFVKTIMMKILNKGGKK
jgi:hypothetical protein